MNEQQIRARLKEIATRLSALDADIDNVDLKSAEAEQRLANLNNEVASLVAERADLNKKLTQIVRSAFEGGNTVVAPNKSLVTERSDLAKLSMRDKMSYILGKRLRGHLFDESEKRALGKALTTTATEYVAASTSVDGVNNAGVFISTTIILDLLKEEGKLSPIFRDINFMHVKGMTTYPYRESRTAAKAKAEGKNTGDNQMKWGKLELTKGYLQIVIPVTDEVVALTDWDLGAYIVSQMLQDLEEDWANDLIYADGTENKVKGITAGAVAAVTGGYAADADIVKVLTDAIKACKGKFRKGAKVYVAQDIYDSVFFSLDKNGNFRYPVFNNTAGISSLGNIRIEVDENLNEGDFIVGNVSKYFKANLLLDLRVEQERQATYGITNHVASEFCATAPFSGAFIYGSKKVGS